MTPAIGDGIIYICLVQDFDKNSSRMAAWNERLVLEANLYAMCLSTFLLARSLAQKLMTRSHKIGTIAGIEQGSIPVIVIFPVARIVSTCFQKIAGIAVITGVIHSNPDDRNKYMETRLYYVIEFYCDNEPKMHFLLHLSLSQ